MSTFSTAQLRDMWLPKNINRDVPNNLNLITVQRPNNSRRIWDIVLCLLDQQEFIDRINTIAGGAYTFQNGLTEVSDTVSWGGTLLQNTSIIGAGFDVSQTGIASYALQGNVVDLQSTTNTDIIAGTNLTLTGTNVGQLIGTTDAVLQTGTGGMIRLVTPAISLATATVGQVPILQNAVSGQIEYGDVITSLNPSLATDELGIIITAPNTIGYNISNLGQAPAIANDDRILLWDNDLDTNSYTTIADLIAAVDTDTNTNIYNSDGTIADPVRTITQGANNIDFIGDANSQFSVRLDDGTNRATLAMFQNLGLIALQGQTAAGTSSFNTVGPTVQFNSTTGDYQLVTAPPNQTTAGNILVRNNAGQMVRQIADGTAGQVLSTDGAGLYSFITLPSGVTDFIALNDTPANYTGAAGQTLRVNAGETGVEFFAPVDSAVTGVVFDGTSLNFTGNGTAFTGSIDISSLDDDSNIGNANLTFAGTRTHDMNGNSMTFTNGNAVTWNTTDNAGVTFNGTGTKVATFNGDIDVTGTIDPDGMAFTTIADVATANAYFTGKGLVFTNIIWLNAATGTLHRGSVNLETAAGTPGIDDVLAVGQQLTTDRTLDTNGNMFTLDTGTGSAFLGSLTAGSALSLQSNTINLNTISNGNIIASTNGTGDIFLQSGDRLEASGGVFAKTFSDVIATTTQTIQNTAGSFIRQNAGGLYGAQDGYIWGAGGFTDSLTNGFNIRNDDGTFTMDYNFQNAGGIPNVFTLLTDGTNQSSITQSASAAAQSAALEVRNGTDQQRLIVQQGSAFLESRTITNSVINIVELTPTNGVRIEKNTAAGTSTLQMTDTVATGATTQITLSDVPNYENNADTIANNYPLNGIYVDNSGMLRQRVGTARPLQPVVELTNTAQNINNAATTDLNWSAAAKINTDTTTYTVATTGVTINEAGSYEVISNVYMQSTGQRPYVELRITVDGVPEGPIGASTYIRNQSAHNSASGHLSTIVTVTAGQEVSVESTRGGTITAAVNTTAGTSNLIIKKII